MDHDEFDLLRDVVQIRPIAVWTRKLGHRAVANPSPKLTVKSISPIPTQILELHCLLVVIGIRIVASTVEEVVIDDDAFGMRSIGFRPTGTVIMRHVLILETRCDS